VRAVQHAQRVAPELAGKEAQDWLDEMQAIEERREVVEKWAAFYRNMQPLLQRYQAAYEAQHQARYGAYAQVKSDLEALGIPAEGLSDRLCEGPVGWSLDGLTCTTCGTGLETLYYQIQSATEEKARLITQEARRKKQEAGSKKQETGKVEPQFEIIRLYDAIKTRDVTTVEDLEAVLSELRQAVQAALQAGKRVILG